MIALPRNLRKRTLLIMLRERRKWDGNSARRSPRIEQWRASYFLPEDVAMFRVCLPLASLVLAALANPHSIQADEPQPGQVLLTIRGHLLPANTVTVSPRVAGQISKINFEEGQRVRRRCTRPARQCEIGSRPEARSSRIEHGGSGVDQGQGGRRSTGHADRPSQSRSGSNASGTRTSQPGRHDDHRADRRHDLDQARRRRHE